jgi:translation initiation factor IF-2
VPIVVAINKIDKPEANPERVKQQLADLGLLIEEWGGDVVCVPVSAKKKQGISDLLENLLVVAEVAELKANPHRPAVGAVIEAGMDKTKGPLATVLIHTGTLKLSDTVAVGDTWGRVKAMFNEKGKTVKQAGPATPVSVLGLNDVPQAGDTLLGVPDEHKARALLQERQAEKQQLAQAPRKLMSLDDLYTQISAGAVKGLNVVLRTDVQGSIEPIRDSLERLGTDKARVRVIHSGSGDITESDVLLAVASKGIVIGFGVRPGPGARMIAELEGVDIRYYDVIYNLVNDVEQALEGMLEPTYVDVIEGHAEVRAIFTAGKKGKVAGAYVTDGRVSRGAQARILRQGKSIYDSEVSSLRRFKDDVTEVAAGFECGVGIEGRSEFEVGDIIELYRKERSS